MKNILIIGYGNTLRGDDAVGILASEMLGKRNPDFKILCIHQLMPEMAEQISESDIVVFIDADENVNDVYIKEISVEQGKDCNMLHFISPQILLGLTNQLYEKTPKTFIVGIPASEFEFSENLSQRTKNYLEKSIIIIESCIKNIS